MGHTEIGESSLPMIRWNPPIRSGLYLVLVAYPDPIMATNVAIDRMAIEDPAAASREVTTDPMDVDDELFSSEWYHCDFETLEILMSRV